MNMFKPTQAKTVSMYFKAIAEPRRSEMETLHVFIQKTVPRLKSWFAYNMVGYGRFPYTFANGKRGDWPVIALASQKNYISVYVCAVKNGKYVAELHRRDFPNASIGKSCIRIKALQDINLKKLAVVLREAAASPGLSGRSQRD